MQALAGQESARADHTWGDRFGDAAVRSTSLYSKLRLTCAQILCEQTLSCGSSNPAVFSSLLACDLFAFLSFLSLFTTLFSVSSSNINTLNTVFVVQFACVFYNQYFSSVWIVVIPLP